jgi:hypothetical protein
MRTLKNQVMSSLIKNKAHKVINTANSIIHFFLVLLYDFIVIKNLEVLL